MNNQELGIAFLISLYLANVSARERHQETQTKIICNSDYVSLQPYCWAF